MEHIFYPLQHWPTLRSLGYALTVSISFVFVHTSSYFTIIRWACTKYHSKIFIACLESGITILVSVESLGCSYNSTMSCVPWLRRAEYRAGWKRSTTY